MQFEMHQTRDTVTMRGTAGEVQARAEAADAAMGMMLLGMILALQKGDNQGVEVDLSVNGASDPTNTRPLEFTVSLGDKGNPKHISCRFLDEKEDTHG